MSKLIRVSEYAYDYLKSLDGKITDNFDEIIKIHSSQKDRSNYFRKRRNIAFNGSRLLSISLLSEAIKKKDNFIDRKETLEHTKKSLQDWVKSFPSFFTSASLNHWRGQYQKALDFQLYMFTNQYGLLKKRESRKILEFWSLNEGYTESKITKIFQEELSKTNTKIKYGTRKFDMEILQKGKSHFLDFKLNNKNFESFVTQNMIKEAKEELKNLINLHEQFVLIDEYKNIIEFNSVQKKLKFQITSSEDVSLPSYTLSDNLEILMKNSSEFLDEILQISNKELMPKKDYFPNIRDYIYKKKESKQAILLINKMKLDYLEKKVSSKKLSGEERENIQVDIKRTTNDNNYKKEISISSDDNWDPVINQLREFRSIQRHGKSLRQ